MIYTDTHMRVLVSWGQHESWSLSLQSWAVAHSRPPVEYPHPGQEAEVLNGALKITQHGMVKEEVIGQYSSLSSSVSYLEALTPRRIKKVHL